MPDMPSELAIERAREAVGLAGEIPGRAAHVARLDRPGSGYYLVCFGAKDATIGVAAVDAVEGQVLSHAKLPGSGPHLVVTSEEAFGRAGAKGTKIARLVWRPCRASFSMLSPFWEVSTARGLVYVDQQGHVWTNLQPAAPGG